MADEMMLIVCRACRKGVIFMTALGSLVGKRGTLEGFEAFVTQHYSDCWGGIPDYFTKGFEIGSEADLGHGVTLESSKTKESDPECTCSIDGTPFCKARGTGYCMAENPRS